MRQLTPFGLEVRTKLLERGLTIADMTRELGFKNVKAVRDFLYGNRPGYKYQSKIEEYLGLVAPEDISVAGDCRISG